MKHPVLSLILILLALVMMISAIAAALFDESGAATAGLSILALALAMNAAPEFERGSY